MPISKIPGGSDLTVQFDQVEIVKSSKGGGSRYKLIASNPALGAKWQQVSPSRATGTFDFDNITGKAAWRDLYGRNNPNSFLTSEGRSVSFDTGAFRKRKDGKYVSRVTPNDDSQDLVTGLWKNASMFVDSTANDDANFVAGAVTGYGLPPVVCGGTSINPVVITNFTNVPQTGSITVNPGLSLEVGVFPTLTNIGDTPFGQCLSRSPGPGNPQAIQENFTVQPNQTAIYYLAMGGTDYNLVKTNNNIAIGGLPGGTANASWYDFWLTLNVDDGFDKLTLNYSGTGGPGNNHQNGFNVTMVNQITNPNGTTTYQNTETILSPYSSTNTNGSWNGTGEPVIYWTNQPIGLAWID
jgi:hypothetical protein